MDGAAAHVVTFGTVAAIEGARARVVLDMAEDGSGFAGPVPPQIGQVVRVDVGEARIFGVIIGLRTPPAQPGARGRPAPTHPVHPPPPPPPAGGGGAAAGCGPRPPSIPANIFTDDL